MGVSDLDEVAAAAVATPRSFDDWMVVARRLAAGQRRATGGLEDIDRYSKAERWAMLRCLERLDEIEAWRATLSAPERARLNDPAKVLARFLAGGVEVDSRDERIARLDLKVAELRDEIARLRARD